MRVQALSSLCFQAMEYRGDRGQGGGAYCTAGTAGNQPSLTAPATLSEITALRVDNVRLRERCDYLSARADSAVSALPNVTAIVGDAKEHCSALSARLRVVTQDKGNERDKSVPC